MLFETKREPFSVEVEFPIYRRLDCDNCAIFTRINTDLSADHIHVYDDGKHVELEVVAHYNFDNSNPDYHLGKAEYKSSEEEFAKAVGQIAMLLSRVMENGEKE
jgi:hypothetical protein